MLLHRPALLKPLLVTVPAAAVLSVANLLVAWQSSRAASPFTDAPAFVLRQHALWATGTILATAATVTVLLLLSASATSLPPPWRSSLGFSVFVLSPVIGLLITAAFNSLLTLPPADDLLAVFITPGKLIVTLPTILGLAALIAFGKPRPSLNGPA